MKQFNCSWFKPTYVPNFSIETEDTINDENRGFDNEPGSLHTINNMAVGDIVEFEDLIIVRLDDKIVTLNEWRDTRKRMIAKDYCRLVGENEDNFSDLEQPIYVYDESHYIEINEVEFAENEAPVFYSMTIANEYYEDEDLSKLESILFNEFN